MSLIERASSLGLVLEDNDGDYILYSSDGQVICFTNNESALEFILDSRTIPEGW